MHGCGGWREASFVAAAVHIKTHKGFYQAFASNELKLLYIYIFSMTFTKYSNRFFQRSIICSQRLFTFSIRFSISCSIHFPEFFLFASNPFSLVFHSDEHKSVFLMQKRENILRCCYTDMCISDVCFYSFVGAAETQTKAVCACSWAGARMWFSCVIKESPHSQLYRYFEQLGHWIKYASA